MCAVFAKHFGEAAKNVFYYRRVRKKNDDRWTTDVFIAMFKTNEQSPELIKQRSVTWKLLSIHFHFAAVLEFGQMTLEKSSFFFSWSQNIPNPVIKKNPKQRQQSRKQKKVQNISQWQHFVDAFHNHNLPNIHTMWMSCEAHTQSDLSKTSIKLSSNCQCLFLNWLRA